MKNQKKSCVTENLSTFSKSVAIALLALAGSMAVAQDNTKQAAPTGQKCPIDLSASLENIKSIFMKCKPSISHEEIRKINSFSTYQYLESIGLFKGYRDASGRNFLMVMLSVPPSKERDLIIQEELAKSSMDSMKRDKDNLGNNVLHYAAENYNSDATYAIMSVSPQLALEHNKAGISPMAAIAFHACTGANYSKTLAALWENNVFSTKSITSKPDLGVFDAMSYMGGRNTLKKYINMSIPNTAKIKFQSTPANIEYMKKIKLMDTKCR